MRFLILTILLGFPLAEGALLYKLAAGSTGHGMWVLAWVVFAACAGVVLIKQARFSLVARLAQALSIGQFSLAALIDSFRAVIAGLLLIFPGLISDALALMLLLIPVREPAFVRAPRGGSRHRDDAARASATETPRRNGGSGTADVIEGEFQRER
jgi:UPF0716 protein FxsA